MDDERPGDQPHDDGVPAVTPAPGSPKAIRRGCRCSVLLNHPPVGGQVDAHLVSPLCPVHHTDGVAPDPPHPP